MDRTYKTFCETAVDTIKSPLKRLKSFSRQEEVFWALKDINFEVYPGEVVGIIGRNGAGKSTLLKILSRITHPTEGEVILRGRVGSLLEVGTGFHPELTGRENIYFNGAILGMTKQEIEDKFDEIVEFSGVADFLDTPLKRYSSGMQVRLAFAVAAHLDPEILVVDEVLAVGDAEFQKKCLGKMKDVATGGRTVLFVSHNMNAILNLCTRALLLRDGKVVFSGNTQKAVEEHLSSTGSLKYGFADLSSHEGRDPNMSVLAKAVGLRTMKTGHEYREVVNTGDDLVFEVYYDCDKYTIDLIQLGISSITGGRVFTVGTHLCPDFNQVLRGQGVIECHLPDVRLTGGEYTVTVMMGKRIPPHNIDYVDNALKFRVEDRNYFNTGLASLPGQGYLAQPSQWRVKSER
jgi:lipopolysaccharide transport system ATP-binding protein